MPLHAGYHVELSSTQLPLSQRIKLFSSTTRINLWPDAPFQPKRQATNSFLSAVIAPRRIRIGRPLLMPLYGGALGLGSRAIGTRRRTLRTHGRSARAMFGTLRTHSRFPRAMFGTLRTHSRTMGTCRGLICRWPMTWTTRMTRTEIMVRTRRSCPTSMPAVPAITQISPGPRKIKHRRTIKPDNRIIPFSRHPLYGIKKITDRGIQTILCLCKNITQVRIPETPVHAVTIISAINTQQIIQINLISTVILLLSQAQLIGHFIRKKPSPVTGLSIRQSRCHPRYQDA